MALAPLLLATPALAQDEPRAAQPLDSPVGALAADEARLVLEADAPGTLYVVDGDEVGRFGAARDDYALLCEAPCSPILARGRHTLALTGRDAVTAHLRAFVDGSRTLRASRDDRSALRVSGVVTLIAGIAISSVLFGVSMAGPYSQDDMVDEATGISSALLLTTTTILGCALLGEKDHMALTFD